MLPYDVAELLRTPEERVAYLEAWLIEAPDDVVGFARSLRGVARASDASIVESGGNLGSEKGS